MDVQDLLLTSAHAVAVYVLMLLAIGTWRGLIDPMRVVLRAVFAYVSLLLAVRASDKRLIARQDTVEFVLALAFADLIDLIDDAVLGHVPASQFAVASVTCSLRAC